MVTYWVYNALATALLLIGLPFLPVLYLLGKRYSMGLGERLGFYGREIRGAVKNSRPVWIHAASVGEAYVRMPSRRRHQETLSLAEDRCLGIHIHGL